MWYSDRRLGLVLSIPGQGNNFVHGNRGIFKIGHRDTHACIKQYGKMDRRDTGCKVL